MKTLCYAVFITSSSTEEAKKLAYGLVKRKLAACVNLIPHIKSVYWWKDKIEEAGEILLIVKTTKEKIKELQVWAKANHSYTVPEIVALPIVEGNPVYLRWLKESVAKRRARPTTHTK